MYQSINHLVSQTIKYVLDLRLFLNLKNVCDDITILSMLSCKCFTRTAILIGKNDNDGVIERR